MPTIKDFLVRVDQIANEQPSYENGHDGSDGKCDCIGLIKGALRRAGYSAVGLSGTNYAARNTIGDFRRIPSVNSLHLADVVLKGRDPGESGYSLPDKYRKGGKEHNGDLTDYYHIGVVTGLNPLRITHMTTPSAKTDTSLGKWAYYGQLPQLAGQEAGRSGGGETTSGGGDSVADITAMVSTPNGGPVNVRAGSGTSFKLVDRIPDGDKVAITFKGDRWSRIHYDAQGRAIVGWISNDYLIFEGETPTTSPSETITLTLTADQARAMLAGLEALEDQIVDKIGRG